MYSMLMMMSMAGSPDVAAADGGCTGRVAGGYSGVVITRTHVREVRLGGGCSGRSAGGCTGLTAGGCTGRSGGCSGYVPPVTFVQSATPPPVKVTTTTTVVEGAVDALDQVNAQRARRGLRPFIRDESLTVAAARAAAHRARAFLFGHTGNDFQFLPAGAVATSAGCAAYPASYGFMACDVYDNYTYAGAAKVMGQDGKYYNHIFVR